MIHFTCRCGLQYYSSTYVYKVQHQSTFCILPPTTLAALANHHRQIAAIPGANKFATSQLQLWGWGKIVLMMWFSFSWQKNIMRPYLLAVFMWKAPPPLSKLPLLPSPPSFLPTSSLLPSPSASPPPDFQFTVSFQFQLNWIQLHLSASPGPLYPTQLTEICESWSQHWVSDLCGSGPSPARRTSGCNPRAPSGPANMAHEKKGWPENVVHEKGGLAWGWQEWEGCVIWCRVKLTWPLSSLFLRSCAPVVVWRNFAAPRGLSILTKGNSN